MCIGDCHNWHRIVPYLSTIELSILSALCWNEFNFTQQLFKLKEIVCARRWEPKMNALSMPSAGFSSNRRRVRPSQHLIGRETTSHIITPPVGSRMATSSLRVGCISRASSITSVGTPPDPNILGKWSIPRAFYTINVNHSIPPLGFWVLFMDVKPVSNNNRGAYIDLTQSPKIA